MSRRIYLSPPHMGGNEINYIKEAFDSNWIAPLGPNVDCFEKEVCKYIDAEHGLALSSGTAGIHLVLKYLGVEKDDYVFCSALTFAASCNPIVYQNAIPVFIDSEPYTWNMSPIALERAFEWAKNINKLPKAVIIVDLYGQSADWDALIPICMKYNVPVIEDSAEALGATYKGKHCGTFGNYGIFSFNGNKIITTSGGGMVVSNNIESINKMRFWATQAREPEVHYEHKEVGYNYRMSNICAGIGRGQLELLPQRIEEKKRIYNRYKEGFHDVAINMMPIDGEGNPNYWISVITVDRDAKVKPIQLVDALEKENIESRPVWKPMHLQPVFKECKFFSHSDDVGEDLFNRGLCLPSGTDMTNQEQYKIIDIIKKTLG